MSSNEYILTDEMETVVTAVKADLQLPVLNYQYGYVEELIQTLKQMEASPGQFDSKYPLVWVAEPYIMDRTDPSVYGIAECDVFIINTSQKDWKAKERMQYNFKPVIIPIYLSILQQIPANPAFSHTDGMVPKHRTVNRYYFSEQGKTILTDVVDCRKISGLKLRIAFKPDCKPFSNM